MKKAIITRRISLFYTACAVLFFLLLFPATAQDSESSADAAAPPQQGVDVSEAPKFGLQASIFRNVRSSIFSDQDKNGKPDYMQNFSLMAEYQLTPGDVFQMVVTSGVRADGSISNNQTYEMQLQKNYNLNVPFMGDINVEGMTLSQLQDYLITRIRDMVPVQYVNITLLSPAQFNVFVYGGVEQPGYIVANPLMGVIEAISVAGGFKEGASYRSVQIERPRQDGGEPDIIVTDISRFYQEGDDDANPTLQPGDKVYIPPADIIATVAGNTPYPGTYELVQGETLKDLLLLAGNIRPDTMTQDIEIVRFQPGGEQTLITLPLSMGDQFELENGDAVTLFSTAVVNQIVTVEGAVFGKQFNKTGSVAVPREPVRVDIAFSPGMSLLSVLDEVGGPTPYFSQSEESYLIRTLRDGSVERTELKIQDLWDTRDTSMDINLLPGDFILVPMRDMNVFLTGQVRKPGAYGFITGYTVDDYILLAGGINEDTADVNTIFFKDERGKRERRANPKEEVKPGDHIYVPKRVILQADRAVQNVLITAGWIVIVLEMVDLVWDLANRIQNALPPPVE